MSKLEELKEELKRWEETDFMRSMSDDFWYSNPRRKAVVAEINRLKAEIKELEEKK